MLVEREMINNYHICYLTLKFVINHVTVLRYVPGDVVNVNLRHFGPFLSENQYGFLFHKLTIFCFLLLENAKQSKGLKLK